MTHFFDQWLITLSASAITGTVLGLVLLALAIREYSYTGPRIREEIRKHYSVYSSLALARLTLYCIGLMIWLGLQGNLLYLAWASKNHIEVTFPQSVLAGTAGILVLITVQFCRHLLYIPSSILMSSNYNMERFIPVWKQLSVTRIRWVCILLIGTLFYHLKGAFDTLTEQARWDEASGLVCLSTVLILPFLIVFFFDRMRARRYRSTCQGTERPNVLLIGCDTLRTDRLGLTGYERQLTPFIDSLCKKGSFFSNCYTPIARTLPSLTSLFTGTWPSRHGIKTNYVDPEDAAPLPPTLIKQFADQGYRTAAISDWSGSDLGKFDYGFEELDIPPDQWNIKYLIRQGPKHLRLIITLFTHNLIGKRLLPELYYLAGIPLTPELGTASRRYLSRRSRDGQPFLLNVFMGTTHPPFGSSYPYYGRFAPAGYDKESKFGMCRLRDPNEIITSQKESKSQFDLNQIRDLYDGCVQCFDDEVRKIVHHLRHCQLDQNTIIVLYSDHGMDFFERSTWGQGNDVFGTTSAKIPLVIVDPRLRGTGKEESLCRSIDIMPTLLDLCGLETPTSVQGESLVPVLQGDDKTCEENKPRGQKEQRLGYFETGLWLTPPPNQDPLHIRYPELIELLEIPDKTRGTLAIEKAYHDIIEQARDRRVQQGNWVLIRIALQQAPRYLLFDMDKDPAYLVDLSKKHPDRVEELKQLMHQVDPSLSDFAGALQRGQSPGSTEAAESIGAHFPPPVPDAPSGH